VPKFSIVNELLSAGILDQRDDGVIIYHQVIEAMMPFNCGATTELCRRRGNVAKLSEYGCEKSVNRGVA
jgi:hypothetical protein